MKFNSNHGLALFNMLLPYMKDLLCGHKIVKMDISQVKNTIQNNLNDTQAFIDWLDQYQVRFTDLLRKIIS